MASDLGSPPSTAPPFAWSVLRARAGDVRDIVRAYLAQSPESRALYHPFPFGRARLVPLLYGLVALRPLAGILARRAPRAAAMLFVGRVAGVGTLAGFGTVRFHRTPDGALVAETGYYVLPEFRRKGLGRAIKSLLVEESRRLGARRAEALISPNNIASVRLNESLGFRIHPSEIRDRHPPHDRFLLAEYDLTATSPPPRPPRRDPTESAEPA